MGVGSKELVTYLAVPAALYLWTGKAFISSSLIEGVVEVLSESNALKVS